MSSPRVVVDTSVVVNFLTGGAANDDPSWFDNSKWVFEASKSGEHQVVIPAIVVAEVAGCGEIRGTHLPSSDRKQRVKLVRDWIERSEFLPAEITLDVALRATDLAITKQLTGADACVLAVAVEYDCEALYTWDNGLLKVADSVADVTVRQPERVLPLQGEMDFSPDL